MGGEEAPKIGIGGINKTEIGMRDAEAKPGGVHFGMIDEEFLVEFIGFGGFVIVFEQMGFAEAGRDLIP